MSGLQYTVLAYAVGLGLLVGYGVSLWARLRGLKRRDGRDGG